MIVVGDSTGLKWPCWNLPLMNSGSILYVRLVSPTCQMNGTDDSLQGNSEVTTFHQLHLKEHE